MDSDSIKTAVERRHPEYSDQIEHWKFCELSYRGGHEYLTAANVFKYFLESQADFEARLKRTYRANHTKRVIDTVNLHLFKQGVKREETLAPKELVEFWKDPTGNGKETMDSFAKELDQWLSVYGKLYVVVDNTPFVGVTQADKPSKPYAYIMHPQHLLDVAYDQQEEILWATVAESRRLDSNPFTSSGKVLTDVRVWTRNEWFLFGQRAGGNTTDDPYQLIDQGANALGFVPIIPVASERGTLYSAPAMVNDIVKMDRTLVNYGSALDEIIYGQTFSQLAIPAQGVLPGTDGYEEYVGAARNRVFMYDGTDQANKPYYLSPDASQAKLILDAMEKISRNIYAVTGTDNEANSQSGSKGKEYASGVVREFDYAAIANILSNKARALERAEEAIATIVMAYKGQKVKRDDARMWVDYPTAFDIRGLEADLNAARELSDLEAPTGMMRQQLKSVSDKLFPRTAGIERDKLHTEIDGWTPKGEFDREQRVAETDIKKKQAEKPPPKPAPAAGGGADR